MSRLLILAESTDPQALAQIHSHLEAIQCWAEAAAQAEISTVLRATADRVERIILEDEPNAEAALESINQTVSTLQAMLNDELDMNTAFPALDPTRPQTNPRIVEPAIVTEEALLEYLSRQAIVLDELKVLTGQLEDQSNPGAESRIDSLLDRLGAESAIIGQQAITKLCQELAKDLSTTGRATLIGALKQAFHWLNHTLESLAGVNDAPDSVENVIAGIQKLKAQPVSPEGAVPPSLSPSVAPPAEPSPVPQANIAAVEPGREAMPLEGDTGLLSDFVIEAREHLESSDLNLLQLETDPRNDEALNSLFRRFHTIKGVAGFIGLDEIRSLAHETENLMDKARKREIELAGSAIDAVFDAVDTMKRLIGNLQQSLASGRSIPRDPDTPALVTRIRQIAKGEFKAPVDVVAMEPTPKTTNKLGAILIEKGVVSKDQLESALCEQQFDQEKKLGEILVSEGYTTAREVAQALRTQEVTTPVVPVQVRETVKVDADRLDQLVEMIGEMVIAESMVSQSPDLRGVASPVLSRHLSQLDKITRELQAMGTSLRMVPLRSTFQKMARLVRDLAKKAGKPVNFVISGEDTELDKTVVDKIGDPLVHMVRNAVDHGLEPNEADRLQSGKTGAGRVELRAFHKGGNIYIEIEDDGRGLNREAILAKAIERGLVREGETPSDREIYNMIFSPGFSTAKVITDVSGRGVGMDVVKRSIDALRGLIDIRTEPGHGTIFSIRLPLTLAIIDGMVIRVGAERFIIPTLSIVRSIRPTAEQLSTILGRGELLSVQEQLIPLFRLYDVFHLPGAVQNPTQAIVVIVEDDGRQIGLLTDELLGQQQIVIKTLGETMRGLPGLSGGAIMTDGQVGLILDVGGLIRLAQQSDDSTRENLPGATDSTEAATNGEADD